MTTTEQLQIVAAMIAHSDTSQPGMFGVYVTDKQLHCSPISQHKPNDLLIVAYSRWIVLKGGTSDFWDLLELKIRGLQEEGLL